MDCKIERARASDAAALLEHLKQIGAETDNLTFGAEGLPVSIEDEESFLGGIENSRDSIFLVAKEDGRIIGNASLHRLLRRMSHRGEIAVSVSRSHWNKGVGSALISGLLDFAKENDFDIIDLQVRSDNLAAVHLYEKFGFEKICTYSDFFKINGEYYDVDYMTLKLK